MTENGLIITLDLDEICRLCLKNDEELTDVFDELYSKEGITLAERIFKIGSVKICVDDGLPLTVCNTCHQKVEDAYEFRVQMIEADNLLRQCIEEDSTPVKASDEVVLLKKKSNCLDVKNCEQPCTASRSETSEDNADLRLVCVEDDGTQVFTLDETLAKITDSVEILPLSAQNFSKTLKRNSLQIEDCEVVVVAKKSKIECDSSNGDNVTSVPLSVVKNLTEKGVLNNCNDLLKLSSLNDSEHFELSNEIELPNKNSLLKSSSKNNINQLKFNESCAKSLEQDINVAIVQDIENSDNHLDKTVLAGHGDNFVAQNSSEGCYITGDTLEEHIDVKFEEVETFKKPTRRPNNKNNVIEVIKTPQADHEENEIPKVLATRVRDNSSKSSNTNENPNVSKVKKRVCNIGARDGSNVDYELNCQLCLERFTDYDALKMHIAAHFDGFLMNESIVDEEDSGEEDAKSYTTKPQPCKFCRVRFKIPSELTAHIETEHSDNKLCCTKCSERFDTELDYKSHYRSNHYSLECDLCNEKFSSYLELQTHVSVIHFNGSFWCQPCSKSFAQKYDFILHQRRHLNIKPFECAFCDKRFVTSTLCKEHVRRHTNNKPYLCKCCGKSYVKHSELKAHETLHAKDSSIVCEFCSKKFSSLSSYKLHRKRHELGSRFMCKICDKSYFTKSEMQRHEQKHSGIRLYPCMICDNSFYSQPELNRHILYHKGEKKYQCTQCGKSYFESGHLRIHERSHTGVRPFACTICPKKFISRPKLIRHLKTHKDVTGSVSALSPDMKTKKTRKRVRVSDANDFEGDKNVVFENIVSVVDDKNCVDGMVDSLGNIVEISDYNRQVISMDSSMVVDCSGNVIEMAEGSLVEMADGNFILMDNGSMISRINNISDENELVLNTIDENVKIEIIDSK